MEEVPVSVDEAMQADEAREERRRGEKKGEESERDACLGAWHGA